MTSWRLDPSSTPGRRTFTRSLGYTELTFHWDAVFNGTADCAQHLTIAVGREDDRALPSSSDFQDIWLYMKRRFPLLGAQVREDPDGQLVEFVVSESALSQLKDEEYGFVRASTSETVHAYIEDAMNGPRKLSDDMLSSFFIVQRDDVPGTFHLVFCAAHTVTDGMANVNIARTFLEALSSRTLPDVPDLVERLAMAVSSESLSPTLAFNPARKRWRNAVAKVLWDKSQARMRGGHGLPNHITPKIFLTPALSRRIDLSLPSGVSQQIVQTCRAHSVTFGQAFPVLAQVALSRVLHRRYLRGEITEEDWQHRLRQPTHTGGPLNLRPLLSEDWVAAGGGGEVGIW
jgi:hypothetical protein